MEAIVIIEKASDGSFSAFAENVNDFGLCGFGNTVDEAKNDLLLAYEEMKEEFAKDGKETPAYEFTYKYDMQSFFDYFSYLNISKVAEKAGINPSLLRQYACGAARASQKQYDRLSAAIEEIKKELTCAVV